MMQTKGKTTLDTLLHDLAKPKPAKQASFVAPASPETPVVVAPLPAIPDNATSAETFDAFFGPDASLPSPAKAAPVDAIPTRVAHNRDALAPAFPYPGDGQIGDPRPNLPGSAWWEATLRMLFRMDGHDATGLYGAFHGLRCCDAVRLAPAERGVRVVVVDATLWGPVRAGIIATKGKAATLDVVLKGVATFRNLDRRVD